jgi:putative membrane protein
MLSIAPAAAHEPVAAVPDALLRAWSFDPLVLTPLLFAAWLYTRGVRRLWTRVGRGRGVTRTQALFFALGLVALATALVSPLDALTKTLLSAHMIQHALLVTVAPPLLLLGVPGAAFAWAMPARSRKRLFASPTWRLLSAGGKKLSHPLPAAVVHGLALWGWHAPAFFRAALENYWLHVFEHALFLGTALLFWSAILLARSVRRAGAGLGAAFATLLHSGLLGALITMAPSPIYGGEGAVAGAWGLELLEDQQLAGLLMWVPMGFVYLTASLVLAHRLLTAAERESRQVKVTERHAHAVSASEVSGRMFARPSGASKSSIASTNFGL